MDETLTVEVCFALPARQEVVSVTLPVGATLADAVNASGLQALFPEEDFETLKKGIWGEVKDASQQLRQGDRVEIYRPLVFDPKEARRRRAKSRQG